MNGTSSPANILTKRQRIAEISRKAPDMVWTTLAHNMDVEWLEEAYRLTRKGGAAGVDGKSSEEYEKSLRSNLLKLLNEAKGGTYYAPPVRRVYIPKGEGKETRPLGIPTFEDKVLQRGAAMLLESVYEQDFLDCSYGFRPGRSAHDAVRRFHQTMMSMGGAFVIKVDIRKYFDTVDHAKLREILGERIRDGVLTRLIGIDGKVSKVDRQLRTQFNKFTADIIDQGKPVTFHRLRHTYATTLLSAGVNILSIMKLLGHKRIEMTLRYAKVVPSHLRKEYLKAVDLLKKSWLPSDLETPTGHSLNMDPIELIDLLRASILKTNSIKAKPLRRLLRRIDRIKSLLAPSRNASSLQPRHNSVTLLAG